VSDVVRVTEFLLPAQMDGEPPYQPPFTGAVRATSPVRLDQLGAELAELTGRSEVALLTDGDTLQAASDHPVVLWTEADVPADALVEAAQAHLPDPNWTPGQSGSTPQLDTILEKARLRRMLTPDEIQVALWWLVDQAATQNLTQESPS
jgi:hypothetical protein